jgi:hypothetical protein
MPERVVSRSRGTRTSAHGVHTARREMGSTVQCVVTLAGSSALCLGGPLSRGLFHRTQGPAALSQYGCCAPQSCLSHSGGPARLGLSGCPALCPQQGSRFPRERVALGLLALSRRGVAPRHLGPRRTSAWCLSRPAGPMGWALCQTLRAGRLTPLRSPTAPASPAS